MYLPMYDYNLIWLIEFSPYFPGRVTVYGIVSHTRQTHNSPSKCGNTPSFFADVDYFLEFIKQSIKPPKRRKPKRHRMRMRNGKKIKYFDYPPDEYESESNGNIYKILWKLFCQILVCFPSHLKKKYVLILLRFLLEKY